MIGVGYIGPPAGPEGAQANGVNDVHVDEYGIMYVVDRLQGGPYIIRPLKFMLLIKLSWRRAIQDSFGRR